MKRWMIMGLVLFALLVFQLVNINAVQFEMKENFTQGETLMARVSGNFLNPIADCNIFLYRKDLQIRVPSQFYAKELEGDYYIYGQLLKEPNNYSLVIKNTKCVKALGEITTEDIIKNFTIIDKIADFSINPGFIETEDNFSISVKNLQDKTITLSVYTTVIEKNSSADTSSSGEESKGFFDLLFGQSSSSEKGETYNTFEKTLNLIPGEEKEIKFSSFRSTDDELKTVSISSENTNYNIPIHILATTLPQNEPIITEKDKLIFNKSLINIQLRANETKTEKVKLKNLAGIELTGIEISPSYSLKNIIKITPEKINSMMINESEEILITIKMNKDELDSFIKNSSSEKNYYGKINAVSDEDISGELEMSITFFRENVTINITKEKTCAEQNGQVCNKNQTCVGNIKYTTENNKTINCCIGNCSNMAPNTLWKIIGWVMLICVAIFLIWFFMKKYRPARSEVNLMKVAEGKKR